MNKDYIVTERVSTLSFLDEEIFKHYVFLNLGKSVLPLVNDKIDTICLEGWTHIDPNINVTSDSEVAFDDDGEFAYRTLQFAFVGEAFLEKATVSEDGCGVLMRLEGNISQILPSDIDSTGVLDRLPPYSLSVLVNVLSLSLLHLVPPFPSGVLATSLTSMAASSLLTAVVAVTAGPTIVYLLTVCAVVMLALTVRAAWRQRHGTTLTLGTAIDVLVLVLGELSSQEAVSVRGVAARLVAIKAKLWDQRYRGPGYSDRVAKVSGRSRVRLVVLALGSLATVLVALVACCPLVTLLGAVAVSALVAVRRQGHRALEGPEELQEAPLAVPSTEDHGDIAEELRAPCDIDAGDAGAAGAKESYFERIDGGLKEAESRLCAVIVGGRDLYHIDHCLYRLTESLRAIGDRIEAERRPRTSDTGAEHCKEAPGGDDCGMKGADTPVAMRPLECLHEEYSMDAMLAKGLSATKEEPESLCALFSVLERGLRATVRHRGVGLEAKVEQRILDEWREGGGVAMSFDMMFWDVNDTWWPGPPAAVVALCSELLEDPRVRAGLGEVAGRLPSSGALSLHALTDTHEWYHYRCHSYRWPYEYGDPCEDCAAVRDLRLEFTGCEGARCVEASLARVRTASLQEFDRRYPLHSAHYPSLSPLMYRLIHCISLNSFLHRVRIELLRRAMITSPASPSAIKSPSTSAASSKVPKGADQ